MGMPVLISQQVKGVTSGAGAEANLRLRDLNQYRDDVRNGWFLAVPNNDLVEHLSEIMLGCGEGDREEELLANRQGK